MMNQLKSRFKVRVDFSKKELKILHIGLCATGKPYNGFQQALVDNALEYAEINCGTPNMNEEAVRVANLMKPDLIFIQIQASGVLSIPAVKKMKQTGAYIVNWTGDVREDVPQWMIELAPHIDNTLFSNMTDVKKMRALGLNSDYLEIGINENIYTNKGEAMKIQPIVFFGNDYGSGYFPMSDFRINMVSYMKSIFKKDFGVYGNWNSGANGNFCDSQLQEASAYRGSKMAINVSHFEYERYSSDRMLRIMGSGTLCLAKWYPCIEEDFTDGIHIRTWKTLEELVDLCNYYMNPKNEEERARIAQAGMELVHSKLTFHHMVENTIQIYKQNR